MRLTWDAAYASDYIIQTLVSGNNWATIYRTSSANGGVDDIRGLSGVGRQIRIYAFKRGSTARNYSLKEIEIYP